MSVHPLLDVLHPFTVSPSHFSSGPTCITNFLECSSNICPIDISVPDFAEALADAPIFDVQLDDSGTQSANPFSWFPEFLMIANIKVRTHPRAADFVQISGE